MKKAIPSATIMLVVALAFGSSGSSRARPDASEQDDNYNIKIDNFSFTPATLTVPVGKTVTWINQDDVPHTVVSADGKGIKSPVLDTDQKFSYTFTKAGAYPYYCGIHPKMTGKVVAQ
jgi:amicyanin